MTKKEGLKKRKLPVTKRLHDQFVMVYVQHSNVGTVHTALYKISKLLLRFPHQFDRKKFSIGLSSFELKFT